MSQTEERVVVLEFDNKSFEQNTQQSLKTLENLDNSLKNAGAANGLEKIGTAAKKIDLSGLSNNVQNVSDRFSTMGIVGMTAIQNITNSIVDLGKKALGQMINGGWTRAANIEKAKFQIEGLKGVWDETSKGYVEGMKTIKEAVNNAVDSTAYGLDEAAVIGSQLMASGITDANQLEEHLKSVSGLAAMTGGSYADIGRIYAQVAGQGRLMGNQLLQISQRGINVAATMKDYANANTEVRDSLLEVAKASGKNTNAVNDMIDRVHSGAKLTEADIRDLVSTGVVSFEFFSAAMGDAFAEHAKDANKTFDGALSNMKAALNRIGAEFATPLRNNLRDLFNAITPVINNIKAAMMPFINIVTKIGTKITQGIVKVLNIIAKATAPVDKVTKTVKKATTQAEKAGKVVKKLSGIMTISKKEARAAFDIWNKGTYGNGLARVKALKKEGLSYKHVQGYVNTLIKYNFDMDKVNKKIRVSSTKAANAVKKHGKESKYSAKAVKELGLNTKYVAKAYKDEHGVIHKILTEEGKRKKKREEEKAHAKFMQAVINNIKLALTSVVNVGKTLWNVIKLIGVSIKTLLKPVTDFIGKKGVSLLKDITALTFKLRDLSEKGLSKIPDAIGKHVNPKLIQFKDKVKDAFLSVKKWFSDNKIFSRAFGSLGTIFKNLVTFVGKFVKSIKEYFTNTKDGQKNAKVLKDILKVIKQLAAGALEKVVSQLEKLSKIQIKPLDFGNIMSGIKGGKIGDFLSSAFSKIKELKKGGIKGALSSLFGVEETYAADGSDMLKTAKTLAGNIGKSGDVVVNATDMLKSASETASGSLDFIKKTGTKLTEAMSSFNWEKVLEGGWDVAKIYAVIKGVSVAEKFAKGLTGVVTSLSGVFTNISFITDKIYKNIGANMKIKMIRDLAISIGILAGSIYLLAKLPAEDAYRATSILVLTIGMLLLVANMAVKMSAKLGRMSVIAIVFLAMAGSILMLAGAMKMFAGMGRKEIAKGLGIITLFIGMFIVAGKAFGAISKGGLAFAGMALAIDFLIPALLILSKLDPATVAKGGIAIMYLMAELAIASRIARSSVRNAASMIAMAAAVNLLVPAVIIMALIPFDKALRGATVIGVIILSLAAAIRAAASMAKLTVWITITSAIAILCGTLLTLAFLPMHKVITAAAALGGVFGSLAVAFYMASRLGSAKVGIIMLAVIIAEIAGTFYLLSKLPVDTIASIGSSLAKALLSVSIACAIMSHINFAGAIIAVGSFAIFIAGLVGVLSALGGLSKIDGFRALLKNGGQILGIIGEALGGFVGSIISGFGKAASSSLPYIGTQLSIFMTNLKPFLDTVKSLDPNVGQTIKNLASAVLMLSGSSFLDAINLFGKQDKFKDFGEQLNSFIGPLQEFTEQAKELDDDAVKAAKKVAGLIKTLASAASEIPNSGWSVNAWFVGDNRLDDFARMIAKTAPYITYASTELVGVNFRSLKKTGKVIKALAEAAQEIPNSGWSVDAWFVGQNNIDKFAEYIAKAAPNIKAAVEGLSTISDEADSGFGRLEKSAKVIKALAQAAQEIPNSGWSMNSWFVGQNNIDKFAEYIADAAPSITKAANALATSNLEKGGMKNLEKIAPLLKSLAIAAEEVPNFNFGGEVENNKVSKFASYIANAAPDIANAANALATANISEGGIENLKSIGPVIKALAEAAKDVTSISGNFEDVGTRLQGLGSGLKDFITEINGLQITNADQVSSLVTSIAKIAEASKGFDPTSFDDIISVLNSDAENSFGKSISNFCTAIEGVKTDNLPNVSKLITALSEAAEKTKDGTFNGLVELTNLLPEIATNLKTFQETIGDAKFKKAKEAAEVLKTLSSMTEMFQKFTTVSKKGAKESSGFDSKTFKAFTDSLDSFAEKIKNFATEMKDVPTEGLTDKASEIKNFLDSVSTAISNANKKMKKKGQLGISNFLKGFNKIGNADSLKRLPGRILNAIGVDNFETKGEKAGGKFIDGLAKAKGAKTAGQTLLKNFKKGAPTDGLNQRGKDVGQGFCDGMASKTGAAASAGVSLYEAAKAAIEAAAETGSPSKKMMELGGFLGEGFVIGLKKYNDEAYKSGEEITNSMLGGVDDSLYSEFGDPVIKPVLDLSDVESGANSIGGMFGTTSINPQLVPQIQNRQNGATEGEVFKQAVDKMSSTIVNSQKTNNAPTYNIGDVTLEVGDLKDVLTLDQFVAVIKKAKAFS